MSRLTRRRAIALTLLGACGAASAAPRGPKVTGTYTSMRYHVDSGDVLGIEVMIIGSRDGYFVVFQSSEGEPAAPILVKADIKATAIQFEIPAGHAYAGRFSGRIVDEHLTGSFSSGAVGPDGQKEIVLVKGQSYWQ